MSSKARIRRPALTLWLMAGTVFSLLAYAGLCLAIGAGVDNALAKAGGGFPGNDVNALVAMMNDNERPLKDRNSAVWALGQLGDRRALPSLEGLVAGAPCDHATAVCQCELGKAIRQCRGGVNITRWAWKPFVL